MEVGMFKSSLTSRSVSTRQTRVFAPLGRMVQRAALSGAFEMTETAL